MRRDFSGWIGRLYSSPLFLRALIVIIFVLILTYQLGSAPAGFSPLETAARSSSADIAKIVDQPINAPHKILVYLLQVAGLNNHTGLRLPSVFIGLIAVLCLYVVVKPLFGKVIGLFASIMLLTTPLFLISARQVSAQIMFFFVIAVIAAYYWWLKTTEYKNWAVILLALLSALALYTPGVIWWLIGAALLSYKKIKTGLSETASGSVIISALVGLLIIVPLALGAARNLDILKMLALVPANFDPFSIIKSIGWMISALFVKAPYHHSLIIGRLPILNVIEIVLLIFGSVALWAASRAKLLTLVAGVVFGILTAGINNNLALLAFCIPSVIILATAGLRYLYVEWRSIFPRNPVAKHLAFALMGTLIFVHLLIGVRYSIVAWPNTIATKTIYVLK